ncbi:MAG: SEC-C metal-binding domain-containing protein [Oscillospiraceae bacterium]|nr:SEC-C metal-binding domain-containing protein [Oscillospiraceae bacterium]
MSKFPRIYAASTIERMYKKLTLPPETTALLFDYFTAMANFYEVLPLKDAYKIIDRHNKGLVSLEQFIAFSEIARHEEHEYFIMSEDELYTDGEKSEPIDRVLVHESLVLFSFEEYYQIAEAQSGKPLYIPSREELLKYKDNLYICSTPETTAMNDFLCKKLKLGKTRAEDIVGECVVIIKCENGNPFEAVNGMLERMDILMDVDQLEEFIALFQDLHNNTRISRNRGFTPVELAKQSGTSGMPERIVFGQNISGALDRGEVSSNELAMQIINGDFPTQIKILMLEELKRRNSVKPISRNAPCPCGSGKKYKRCCGK